jgi:hypothetical protein
VSSISNDSHLKCLTGGTGDQEAWVKKELAPELLALRLKPTPIAMDENHSARIDQLVAGLREIREVSSLKRLEASVIDDLAGRLRVAGQALERIDGIVNRLLDDAGPERR